MRTAKRITYFSALTIEDFDTFLAEDERDIQKDSNEYFELYGLFIENDFDDFLLNVKHSTHNTNCIVLGTIGRWNGTYDIIPQRFNNLVDAINACCSGADLSYLTITKVNGHLEICVPHHDNTNYFEIHLLNKKGIFAGENADLSNRCYHKAMEKYLY